MSSPTQHNPLVVVVSAKVMKGANEAFVKPRKQMPPKKKQSGMTEEEWEAILIR
jgi:hypothetical protein